MTLEEALEAAWDCVRDGTGQDVAVGEGLAPVILAGLHAAYRAGQMDTRLQVPPNYERAAEEALLSMALKARKIQNANQL